MRDGSCGGGIDRLEARAVEAVATLRRLGRSEAPEDGGAAEDGAPAASEEM